MSGRRQDPGRPDARTGRTHGANRPPTGTPVAADELRVSAQTVVPAGSGADGGGGARARLRAAAAGFLARDALVLATLLVLAAAVRLPGLETRGDFDGDQGHDMLTLLRFVRDGVVPLLGPPTSIGDFHHGAAYYYLLAPVVWLFGAQPPAVLTFIAVLGVGAVGLTWWLARAIGGRAAALVAGLLLAVSPAAIEESTFIWNPSPIAFFAVLALAAVWRGHQTGRARWWTLAVLSAGMVIQLHVLGVVFLPPIIALGIVDWRAARRRGDALQARRVVVGILAGLALVAVLFVPLLVHELQSSFTETRNALAYFSARPATDAGGSVVDPFERLVFTGLRVIGWPLLGLVTSAPFATVIVVSVALVLGAWRMVAGRGDEGLAARWLGFTIAWSAIALTALAPSLQTVVIGLPNDHYHAFLDPIVIVLVALGLWAMASGSGLQGGMDRTARIVVVGVVIAILALEVSRWPPLRQANGGWPAARDAGARIAARSPGRIVDIRGLPVFKTAEGIAFPVVAAGGSVIVATDEMTALRPATPGALIVIVCDRLFEPVLDGTCGGSAEARFLARIPGVGTGIAAPALIDRFDASPRTAISVYRPVAAGGSGTPGPEVAGQRPRARPPRTLRVME